MMLMTPLTTKLFLFSLAVTSATAAREPLVAPFVDVTRMPAGYLVDLHRQTQLKAVTLAFVLGTGYGCEPSWGGESNMKNEQILTNIKEFQRIGGQVILATGGAAGPYLEASCGSADELATAYHTALDLVDSSHLDIDIEASVNGNMMMDALKILKSRVPHLTVSFTLMVQGDDYGLNDILGVAVLKNAVKRGVAVDMVNAMTMEFWSKKKSWGAAVIAAGEAVFHQMKQIWPEKSDQQLYSMLGITPMIGHNFNGRVFQIQDAHSLVAWAKQKNIGHLSFWSIGRDNGKCPNGGISPDCSGIAQQMFEFTKIFQEYAGGTHHDDHDDQTTPQPNPTTEKPDPVPTSRPTPTTVRPPNTRKPEKIDCSTGQTYFCHETDCNKYYWCYEGVPHLEQCAPNTVWDPKINSCNYACDAHRTDCV